MADDSRSGASRPARPESTAAEVLDLVRTLAAEVRELDLARASKSGQLTEALARAHAEGYSWADIARASEYLTSAAVQNRVVRADLLGSTAVDGEYVSVVTAAKELGVTRSTVYQWASSGRIASMRDASGRLRVQLPN